MRRGREWRDWEGRRGGKGWGGEGMGKERWEGRERSGKGREREKGRGEKGKREGREEGRGGRGKGRAGGAFWLIKIYDYTLLPPSLSVLSDFQDRLSGALLQTVLITRTELDFQ